MYAFEEGICGDHPISFAVKAKHGTIIPDAQAQCPDTPRGNFFSYPFYQ
jgi:hypothetical protein